MNDKKTKWDYEKIYRFTIIMIFILLTLLLLKYEFNLF